MHSLAFQMQLDRRLFLRHTGGVPISYRPLGVGDKGLGQIWDIGRGGLSFSSVRPLTRGTGIEIDLLGLGAPCQFPARVLWSKHTPDSYRIGARFGHEVDAFHARMLVQVCHIESYRREVQDTEGRQLTSERAAEEWIRKYASRFPSL